MATTNPIFRKAAQNSTPDALPTAPYVERLTLNGIFDKTGLLLLISIAGAIWGGRLLEPFLHDGAGGMESMPIVLAVSIAVASGLLFLTLRRKELAPVIVPVYALVQGILLASAAFVLDVRYAGVGVQLVAVTATMFLCLLVAYRLGLVRLLPSYNGRVMLARGAGALFYAVNFGLGYAGMQSLSVLAGGIPALFGVVVIALIVALSLVSAFDDAVQYAKADLPKSTEWVAAFGLVLMLVWAYVDILRITFKGDMFPRGTIGGPVP